MGAICCASANSAQSEGFGVLAGENYAAISPIDLARWHPERWEGYLLSDVEHIYFHDH